MVSRLGSYQTKDNATNGISTRQHHPRRGMLRKQKQALASLRAHHNRGLHQTKPCLLMTSSLLIVIQISWIHQPTNLETLSIITCPTNRCPSHNRQHSCLNGAKVMKINGLRKLLEKKLHTHATMFHGKTPTGWHKNRVNNMGFSALYALHLQVKNGDNALCLPLI